MYGANGNLLKDNITPFLAEISKYIDIEIAKASGNFNTTFAQTQIPQSDVEKWLTDWNGMATNISIQKPIENAMSTAILNHKTEIE